MKINDETINLGYVAVERHQVQKNTLGGLYIPGESVNQYAIGKVTHGEKKGMFCLFPVYSGVKVETKFQTIHLIPINDIIAFVEPDDDETFIALNEVKVRPAEWIGGNSGK